VGVKPSDIDVSNHFWDAFDHMETEISARWIVRFLQDRDDTWGPFTREELEAYYTAPGRRPAGERFNFNRLVSPELVPRDAAAAFAGFIGDRVEKGGGWVERTDGRYQVTEDFIRRCAEGRQKAREETQDDGQQRD